MNLSQEFQEAQTFFASEAHWLTYLVWSSFRFESCKIQFHEAYTECLTESIHQSYKSFVKHQMKLCKTSCEGKVVLQGLRYFLFRLFDLGTLGFPSKTENQLYDQIAMIQKVVDSPSACNT